MFEWNSNAPSTGGAVNVGCQQNTSAWNLCRRLGVQGSS